MKCTRCGRVRPEKTPKGYVLIKLAKVYGGKKKYRCTAKSTCSSIARRNKLGRGPNSAV